MARVNLAQLNAEFASHGFGLVKGNGYFYFASAPGAPDYAVEQLNPQSIMVVHFKQMPVSRWRAAMAEVAEQLKRHRAAQSCTTCHGTGRTPAQYIGHEGHGASFPCNHGEKA